VGGDGSLPVLVLLPCCPAASLRDSGRQSKMVFTSPPDVDSWLMAKASCLLSSRSWRIVVRSSSTSWSCVHVSFQDRVDVSVVPVRYTVQCTVIRCSTLIQSIAVSKRLWTIYTVKMVRCKRLGDSQVNLTQRAILAHIFTVFHSTNVVFYKSPM